MKKQLHTKQFVLLWCTAMCLVFFFTVSSAATVTTPLNLHDVYLANTEHELHVFRIYGKKPGKTIMLIGGIQGDEPGGYLTADLYADITLTQGNLIVVPRANFYSILFNQRNGMTGDMNRKFGQKEESQKNLEQEIVTILKKLIDEADCLLNLHEGSGFYHPEWVNDMENPNRYGQSIIFDAETFYSDKYKRTIELESLAQSVISRVTPQIENPRYHFKTNNHNTISDATQHPEQRKSATYYALTRAKIPAFGIETSKSIRANTEKVALQKLVVNSFMKEFGIIAETPGPHLEKTELSYVLIKVNGGLPYAVPNGSVLQINSGDEVIITDIIANFQRGLAADFVDMGSYNDTKLPFRIAQPTKVIIRKDAETCGYVDININAATPTVATSPKIESKMHPTGSKQVSRKKKEISLDDLRVEKLLLNVNGKLMVINEGNEITVPKDKVLILKGAQSNISRLDKDIYANLKGFAPPKTKNDGNDINYPVYPEQDLWVRYSENKKGVRYPINTTYNNKKIGKFWIRIE